jgi:hypothetical protein
MSRKSKSSWYVVPNETPSDPRSAEFVRTYGAIVDALAATVVSAQAGLDWLNAQPPDLEEVRRTLNSIANDGMRAGEIVARLRAPMRRSPTPDDSFEPSDTYEIAGPT